MVRIARVPQTLPKRDSGCCWDFHHRVPAGDIRHRRGMAGLEHAVVVGELVVATALVFTGYRRVREATARADVAEAALVRAQEPAPTVWAAGAGPDRCDLARRLAAALRLGQFRL